MSPEQDLSGRKISVLGCGWLGFPLAQKLVQEGASVNGSTTSPEKLRLLEQHLIQPFLIDLADPDYSEYQLQQFLDADNLVIAIPLKSAIPGEVTFLSRLKSLGKAIEKSATQSVVFISSTGVYADGIGLADEDCATRHSDRATRLLDAEELFNSIPDAEVTIIRFGGLFGPGRHPGKFLAGKKDLPNGNSPVNFIHQQDAMNCISEVLRKQAWGLTLNVVADEHPTRKEFFTQAAKLANLAPPTFSTDQVENPTLIDNSRLKQVLDFRFNYPDPLAALAAEKHAN